MKLNKDFWENKKVFITGHTGFKGSYMCKVLLFLGAKVYGYALKEKKLSLYNLLDLKDKVTTFYGDIRNYDKLLNAIKKIEPDVLIHLAAQPLVRESYNDPLLTYGTNVMGTLNVLEAIRNVNSIKSFINVTTDKVYLNNEDGKNFKENDILNGFDPYSNSKSCSELITSTYRNCFFKNKDVAITTCRAGNVIGGGDFAKDRIIPDAMRAILNNETLIIRNPNSIRPYQHVLEPIYQYLLIAQEQYNNKKLEGAYNIGPNINDCITTKKLIDIFKEKWDKLNPNNKIKIIYKSDGGPYESNFLKLDCTKIKKIFGYNQFWNIDKAIEKVIEFIDCYFNNNDIESMINNQINEYIDLLH